MNIKEVRVGNYLLGNRYSYENDYKLFQVESIHEDGLNIHDGREGMDINYDWDNIKPIPFDEHWARRFGFECVDDEIDYSEWELGNFQLTGNGSDGQEPFTFAYYEYEGLLEDIEIKYVHQLQNLYFALTGNELSAE